MATSKMDSRTECDQLGTGKNEKTGIANPFPDDPEQRNEADSNDIYMYHNGDKLVVLTPVTTLDLGQQISRSTTGFVKSDHAPGIRMGAISGWSGPKNRCPDLLDNDRYTKMVMDVAPYIDFDLPAHRLDMGYAKAEPEYKGRFMACHIEKKLAVWWVRKCIKVAFGSRHVAPGLLRELKKADLPDAMREARIYLDHEPCRNCLSFLRELGHYTDMLFSVKSVPFLVEGKREAVSFIGDASSTTARQ